MEYKFFDAFELRWALKHLSIKQFSFQQFLLQESIKLETISILNYYTVCSNMLGLSRINSIILAIFFQWCTRRTTQKCTVHGCSTKPDIRHFFLIFSQLRCFWRLLARVLIFNCFACFWPKGYQSGSLGKSHKNGDYLKQAMQKSCLPTGFELVWDR